MNVPYALGGRLNGKDGLRRGLCKAVGFLHARGQHGHVP